MVALITYNDVHMGRAIARPLAWVYEAIAKGEMTIEDVAARAVPTGRPYAIVDSSELPGEWSGRDAWAVADIDLTDGFGGPEGVPAQGIFQPQEEAEAA